MASLKDAAKLTNELNELTSQLHSELTEGEVDFEKMIALADEISEKSDGVAAAFTSVNEAIAKTLDGQPGSDGGGAKSSSEEASGSGEAESEGDGSNSGSSGSRTARKRSSSSSR